jgi:hypothetical protein
MLNETVFTVSFLEFEHLLVGAGSKPALIHSNFWDNLVTQQPYLLNKKSDIKEKE